MRVSVSISLHVISATSLRRAPTKSMTRMAARKSDRLRRPPTADLAVVEKALAGLRPPASRRRCRDGGDHVASHQPGKELVHDLLRPIGHDRRRRGDRFDQVDDVALFDVVDGAVAPGRHNEATADALHTGPRCSVASCPVCCRCRACNINEVADQSRRRPARAALPARPTLPWRRAWRRPDQCPSRSSCSSACVAAARAAASDSSAVTVAVERQLARPP